MTTILIPAYEPDERLLNLIGQLKKMPDTWIVIVDDGSGEAYRPIFDSARAAGCIVLRHEVNRGKGRALKTGFRYLLDAGQRGPVVCADSDGQHLPADIGRVVAAVREQGCSLVLGSRRFTGKVPLRSRFGNAVTRFVFAFTTGTKIYDTQTGLRGYSSGMLEWLCSVPGERFEYEMNLLLGAKRKGCSLAEVFIDTVYLDDNKSSHFRPLADSARIYLPILLFSASSILSAGIDFALLFLLQAFSKNLALSVAGARICSSAANFAMNRRFVFARGHGRSAKLYASLPRYFSLVLIVLLLNMGLMHVYHDLARIPLIGAKLLTEGSLFLFSYWVQRKYVY
ncbi:bifunctional glycosyltransferase family 2/GtrA family protein [Paenibacillus sp. FSL R5-0527]|uniref:bifunctional glycosyltransferase family 2/GtrA family protein n=1 Tax=Paenibacillus sp. FSL R5-0527 TaxID=2975321 RepID=UPI00097B1C8D|nr:glycosyl transferase family 2 [Paenibacillus macerans]